MYLWLPVRVRASTCRYVPVRAGTCQYVPVRASTCQYVPVRASTCQYVPKLTTVTIQTTNNRKLLSGRKFPKLFLGMLVPKKIFKESFAKETFS